MFRSGDMLDAILWACIASSSVATFLTIATYVMKPWPTARLAFMVVGVPASYVIGGLLMADAVAVVHQSAVDLMSGGICLSSFALPCFDLAGGCSCGTPLWSH